MSLQRLSVLIACFNEEKTISDVISAHLEILKNNKFTQNYEIIILNDGSTDDSNRIIKKWVNLENCIKLIENEIPSGIFRAQNQLYKSTSSDWLYFTSGDGQYPASILEEMLNKVTIDDFIIVSKRINKFEIYNFQRILISYAYRLLCFLISGYDSIDPGSTKLVSRKLFDEKFVCSYLAKDAEIVIKAKKINKNIKVVNSKFGNRTYGKSSAINVLTLFRTFFDLLKLIKYRFN